MNYGLAVAGICGLGTLQAHLTVGCWPVVGVRKWVRVSDLSRTAYRDDFSPEGQPDAVRVWGSDV